MAHTCFVPWFSGLWWGSKSDTVLMARKSKVQTDVSLLTTLQRQYFCKTILPWSAILETPDRVLCKIFVLFFIIFILLCLCNELAQGFKILPLLFQRHTRAKFSWFRHYMRDKQNIYAQSTFGYCWKFQQERQLFVCAVIINFSIVPPSPSLFAHSDRTSGTSGSFRKKIHGSSLFEWLCMHV